MKDKVITVILSIIVFVTPILIAPSIWNTYNILKIYSLIICGFILFIMMLTKMKEWKFDKKDILIYIFGLLAIFSTILSTNAMNSIIGSYNRYEGLLTILIYILIYYNAKYYFKNFNEFVYIGAIIYICICIFAMIQFFISDSIVLSPILGRGANGTFGNTNFMGNFVSIVLPTFILGYIFRNRKIYLVGSIVGFCSMMMCIARSSWVAFIVYMLAILVYLIVNKKKKYFKRFSIIIIMFIISLVSIISLDKQNIISSKFGKAKSEMSGIAQNGLNDNMGSGRIKIWKITCSLICKVPIFGCGVDSLQYGLDELCHEENMDYIIEHSVYIDKAHNEYLQIAATMGIPALIIYLIFIGMICIPSIQKIKKHKVIAVYTIVIISYLVQAFFNISTIGIAPIFWFILGMESRNISYVTKSKSIQK